MSTFHIHISGIVQGVGFRPLVCQRAAAMGLNGWVCNGNDGVHIRLEATREQATAFQRSILDAPPRHAIITHHEITETTPESFTDFTIRESRNDRTPDLLLTPDIALCPECRRELHRSEDRRKGYAFTTCLHCGPRYSIMTALPYDRANTTMANMEMCPDCGREYTDIHDRRHHSQTNSCPTCAIPMHLFDRKGHELSNDPEIIIPLVVEAVRKGGIVAVKGTGGYLLMADATSPEAIRTLRQRKKRPAKPFALLYRDRVMAEQDARVRNIEYQEMISPAAPIVLCRKNDTITTGLQADLIAPGLDKIGIMLPNTPLLQLLADGIGRPLLCTSANLSGSPIIHDDGIALDELFRFADLLLTHDRAIVVPQDDSVVQFNASGDRIILRRSRGIAPNFFPQRLGNSPDTILAMGADMKAAFALHHRDKVFISQYLGDQADVRAQEGFAHTLAHLCRLLQAEPSAVLTDAHPGYHSTMEGERLARQKNIAVRYFQHHRAHFAAVLAEHGALTNVLPTLGFIWDGTGYGDDGDIWGGETFLLEDGRIERVVHLAGFPQVLGDKMSREPRLSALSLMNDIPEAGDRLEKFFSAQEWKLYRQPAFWQQQKLRTSSMGRLLDAVSALLTGCALHGYEGEAVMLLEALARTVAKPLPGHYPLPLDHDRLETGMLLKGILHDLDAGAPSSAVADKVFRSLVRSIFLTADRFGVRRLAFSGGVFQNALLTDMIRVHAADDHELLFHRNLPPNDENIAFGQLALHHLDGINARQERNDTRQETTLETIKH